MPKIISPQVEYCSLLNQRKAAMPEVFTSYGKPSQLLKYRWQEAGAARVFHSSIDGALLGNYADATLLLEKA